MYSHIRSRYIMLRLFVGETSAGKSSILNLMFGEEVVPTFFGSCTSVITRIKYCKERRAKIYYRDGTKKQFRHIPPNEICKVLKPYLFVEDERDRDKNTNIKEVKIECPAKLLEVILLRNPKRLSGYTSSLTYHDKNKS